MSAVDWLVPWDDMLTQRHTACQICRRQPESLAWDIVTVDGLAVSTTRCTTYRARDPNGQERRAMLERRYGPVRQE